MKAGDIVQYTNPNGDTLEILVEQMTAERRFSGAVIGGKNPENMSWPVGSRRTDWPANVFIVIKSSEPIEEIFIALDILEEQYTNKERP